MRLALVCGKKKLTVKSSRIVGRGDFPDQELLSRKHFAIRSTDDGRVLVVDLGSANGTTLSGARLAPNTEVEWKTNDQLGAGGLLFSLTENIPSMWESKPAICALIFVVLSGVLLSQPSMAFGRALGWQGLSLLAVTLAAPLVASSWFFNRISNHSESPWPVWRYALAVLVSTMVLNDGMVELLSYATDIDRVVAVNKIRYFCLSKFVPARCVTQINSCPGCAGLIGDDDRKTIAGRLRFYYRQPAQARQTAR
jgi:hypothetical protein